MKVKMEKHVFSMAIAMMVSFGNLCAASEDELIGGWSGMDRKDPLVIYLEKGGTGHTAGGMGMLESRWSVLSNGLICVITPNYHGLAWKNYFKRDSKDGQLVRVKLAVVDLKLGVEKKDQDDREIVMEKFGEAQNRQMRESIKQCEKLVERSEAMNRGRDQPLKMQEEEFVLSDKRGINEILDCLKLGGFISIRRENDPTNCVSVARACPSGLTVSVFLGTHVYGDESMKSDRDERMSCGGYVTGIPADAKLKYSGARPEFVNKFKDAIHAIGVNPQTSHFSSAKAYYSNIYTSLRADVKGRPEAEIVSSLIEFMRSTGPGDIMVHKAIRQNK